MEWREQTAERQNRPVQSVLSDAALVEIARRKPSSRGQLEKIRGVGGERLRQTRRGPAARRSSAAQREPPDPTHRRTLAHPSPRPDDAPLVALAEALLRARAREAGLAYELLAARADLQAIVAAARAGEQEADVRTLRGWRRELAGAELLELLAGHGSLSVSGGKLRVSR